MLSRVLSPIACACSDIGRAVHADGFGGLQADFFDKHQELTTIQTVTAYVVLWGSVFILTFLLFNCAVAVVFMSFSVLKDVYTRLQRLDAEKAANVQVSLPLQAFRRLNALRPAVLDMTEPYDRQPSGSKYGASVNQLHVCTASSATVCTQ